MLTPTSAMAAHVATVLGTSAGIVGLLLHGLVAVLFGLGLLWAIVRIYSVILKIVVAAIALVEVAVLFWLLQLAGVSWLPYPVLISGLLATLCGLAYSQSKAGQRRRSIEGMLKGRVSHATLQKFLVSEAPFPFAAEKRGASRVECQISNLEELAAKLASLYHETLTEAVTVALRERLARASREEPIKRMKALAEEIHKLMPEGMTSENATDFLYNEEGLPV